jgi:hypothetical protein
MNIQEADAELMRLYIEQNDLLKVGIATLQSLIELKDMEIERLRDENKDLLEELEDVDDALGRKHKH